MTIYLIIFLFFLLILIAIVTIRKNLNDSGIDFDLLEDGAFKRILIIFAHPDDEVFIGGTLKKLHKCGARTFLLTLTNGEKGKCKEITDSQILSARRLLELRQAINELSISDYKICQLPDYNLNSNTSKIKQEILLAINKWKPQIIITHDHEIGFYGHPDHIAVANSLLELHTNNKIKIERIYGVTLAKNLLKKIVFVARLFKLKRLKQMETLPKAELSINISKYAVYKRKAIQAHKSQFRTLQKAFPFFSNYFLSFLYFSIFTREYFYRMNSDGTQAPTR